MVITTCITAHPHPMWSPTAAAVGNGADAMVTARNAVAEVQPHATVHSIIAALNESCKHMAQFLQLLEYSWRSTWYLDACAALASVRAHLAAAAWSDFTD